MTDKLPTTVKFESRAIVLEYESTHWTWSAFTDHTKASWDLGIANTAPIALPPLGRRVIVVVFEDVLDAAAVVSMAEHVWKGEVLEYVSEMLIWIDVKLGCAVVVVRPMA